MLIKEHMNRAHSLAMAAVPRPCAAPAAASPLAIGSVKRPLFSSTCAQARLHLIGAQN